MTAVTCQTCGALDRDRWEWSAGHRPGCVAAAPGEIQAALERIEDRLDRLLQLVAGDVQRWHE